MRRTHFLSVEATTIHLIFMYYLVENRLEQRYFLKKNYVWATWSFYITGFNRKPIDAGLIIQKSLIAKKAWHWKWRPSLYDSWVVHLCSSMFWNRSDHKKYGFVLVLYPFRVLVLSNQEKVITLSCHVQYCFINKKDKYLYHYTARDSFLNVRQNF